MLDAGYGTELRKAQQGLVSGDFFHSNIPSFHSSNILRPLADFQFEQTAGKRYSTNIVKRRKLKPANRIMSLICIALIAGCSSVGQRRAMIDGNSISNPSLGFFGFSFEIPAGFGVYNPAIGTRGQEGELQQLAIRVYNLNRDYHPRGNETFYDSFLLLSENTGVLLITLKTDNLTPLDTPFTAEAAAVQSELIPLYNVSGQEVLELGEARAEAVCTRGHAYEQKGWYYANERRKRMLFRYEACKVSGSNRDRYILMGFSLPENQDLLRSQMQEMIRGLRF